MTIVLKLNKSAVNSNEAKNPMVPIKMVRRIKSPSGADDERVGWMGLMKMLLLFNKTNLRMAITSEMVDVIMEII